MTLPQTVSGVLERLREIDASLPPHDGAAVFNHLYLTVTERIDELLSPGSAAAFADPRRMADLDIRFAAFWIGAFEATADGQTAPTAWSPLFEQRSGGQLPIQYALAGMNTHIEHDLPLAVLGTCEALAIEPVALREDYEAVNGVLAKVEAEIRRTFLTDVGRHVDDQVSPAVHLVSAWNIDKARDLAWVTVEALWELRAIPILFDRYRSALAHTVGMTSRTLLTPLP